MADEGNHADSLLAVYKKILMHIAIPETLKGLDISKSRQTLANLSNTDDPLQLRVEYPPTSHVAISAAFERLRRSRKAIASGDLDKKLLTTLHDCVKQFQDNLDKQEEINGIRGPLAKSSDFHGTYYAFVEARDRVGRTSRVRLDAFRVSQLARLVAFADRKTIEPGDRDEFPRIPTVFFEFNLDSSTYARLPGLGRRRLSEDRWYKLVISEDPDQGIPARCFSVPEPGADVSDAAESTGIEDIQWLNRRESEAANLARAFDISDVPTATEQDAIRLTKLVADARSLASYYVGQGSCAAICDAQGRPIVYLDIGGGCLSNARSYPTQFKLCFLNRPLVVLSHWDLDHWYSASRQKQAQNLMWYAPRQDAIGPTHKAFIWHLANKDRIRFWPAGLALDGVLQLARCTGRSRNDSGLAALVTLGDERALLPGDAHYRFVPTSASGSLDALVATHHGAKYRRPEVPQGVTGLVCYSYGGSNSFGHAHQDSRAYHADAGWTRSLNLVDGSARLIPHVAPGAYETCTDGCTLSQVQW